MEVKGTVSYSWWRHVCLYLSQTPETPKLNAIKKQLTSTLLTLPSASQNSLLLLPNSSVLFPNFPSASQTPSPFLQTPLHTLQLEHWCCCLWDSLAPLGVSPNLIGIGITERVNMHTEKSVIIVVIWLVKWSHKLNKTIFFIELLPLLVVNTIINNQSIFWLTRGMHRP